MPRPKVLLLEDDPNEATLAESALRLAGAELVTSFERAVVAVLGRKALAEAGPLPIPAVAILPAPTEEERRRAAERGVRAVFDRPATWRDYAALVERVVADATRKG
ncbi:MAG TPA: hypothetical protein VFV74_01030 [Burkholderiales bacterium]|nr:hypothetical protein [Burkholderiales bacterium]